MSDKPLSAAQAVARIRLRVNTNWNSREAAMGALAEVAECIEPLAALETQLADMREAAQKLIRYFEPREAASSIWPPFLLEYVDELRKAAGEAKELTDV